MSSSRNQRRGERGFAMIEVMVAAVVLAIVVVGAGSFLVHGLRARDEGGYLDETKQVNDYLKTETTKLLRRTFEQVGPCSPTILSDMNGNSGTLFLSPLQSSTLRAQSFPNAGDIAAACRSAAPVAVIGGKITVCTLMSFRTAGGGIDPQVMGHFPAIAAVMKITLRDQATGGEVACGAYQSLPTRGFDVHYWIDYKYQPGDKAVTRFATVEGEYYGAGK